MATDPERQATLDAEFAALKEELDRIAAERATLGADAVKALALATKQWEARAGEAERPPEAREKMEDLIREALRAMLLESATADVQGNLTFQVDDAALKKHGTPILLAAVERVQQQIQQALPVWNAKLGAIGASVVAGADAPERSDPRADETDRAEAHPEAGAAKKPPKVELKVDLLGIVQSMLQKKKDG